MAQDPLVRRESVSASCNRRPDEGLETQKYSLCPKEHPANCPLRWRLSNGLGVCRCRSANSGRLMTLLDLSPADFRRFLTVLVDRRLLGSVLFEYGTGCEWHPSNQTLQCPVVMIRCYPWSARSWQVFHIVHASNLGI
jgi:hypothetical protein